jgi:hypothetical protein
LCGKNVGLLGVNAGGTYSYQRIAAVPVAVGGAASQRSASGASTVTRGCGQTTQPRFETATHGTASLSHQVLQVRHVTLLSSRMYPCVVSPAETCLQRGIQDTRQTLTVRQNTVFEILDVQVVISCSLVGRQRCFGRIFCFHPHYCGSGILCVILSGIEALSSPLRVRD